MHTLFFNFKISTKNFFCDKSSTQQIIRLMKLTNEDPTFYKSFELIRVVLNIVILCYIMHPIYLGVRL